MNSRAKMKAIRLHEFGGPEVLRYEDAPVPELKPGEVLVRVHAVGIDPPDWYLRDGYKMLPPEWQPKVAFPVILGTDISRVVEAVADDVNDFSAGDEVYSMVRFPSGLVGDSKAYADFVSVPASEVALKPTGIDHAHAAGAPMSLLTAWQYIIELGHETKNPLQPHMHEPVPLEGKTVLVNGAAGGVGHFAVQLARLKGARIIAVASGKNDAFLRDLGAGEFIDYTKLKPEDVVRDVDLVIDAVGGPTTGRFLRTLKRGGALFPIFPLGFSGTEEAEKPTPFGVDADAIAPLAQSRVEASDDDRDVFGDGTVRILKAPGHTPGSRMLLVKLTKSGPVLITGDLFHTRENYEKDLVPSANISRADTLASSQRLRRIAANTHARLVIQHDPTDFSSMPIFPKYLD